MWHVIKGDTIDPFPVPRPFRFGECYLLSTRLTHSLLPLQKKISAFRSSTPLDDGQGAAATREGALQQTFRATSAVPDLRSILTF